MPHPSEPLVNMRLQTDPSSTALQVFLDGLNNLANIADFIGEEFDKSLITAGISPDRMEEFAEEI